MNQQQSQVQIDPSQGELVKCESLNCKGAGKGHWDQKLTVKRLSAITSPTGKEMYIQVPIMTCTDCGDEFPAPSSLDA